MPLPRHGTAASPREREGGGLGARGEQQHGDQKAATPWGDGENPPRHLPVTPQAASSPHATSQPGQGLIGMDPEAGWASWGRLSAVRTGDAGRVCSEHPRRCPRASSSSHGPHNRPAVGGTHAPTKPLTAPLHPAKPCGPHGGTGDGHQDRWLERGRGGPRPRSRSQGQRGTAASRETPGWQHRAAGRALPRARLHPRPNPTLRWSHPPGWGPPPTSPSPRAAGRGVTLPG